MAYWQVDNTNVNSSWIDGKKNVEKLTLTKLLATQGQAAAPAIKRKLDSILPDSIWG